MDVVREAKEYSTAAPEQNGFNPCSNGCRSGRMILPVHLSPKFGSFNPCSNGCRSGSITVRS